MARGYGGMSGYGGYGAMGGPPPDSPEAKKEFARKQLALSKKLSGKAGPDAKKEDEALTPEEVGPWKETTRGLRWVAITGVLDHKKMRDNYLTALKNPSVAQPNYKQLDVQRQVLQSDGSWSDWEDVDINKNREISFHLPEVDEELAPDDVLLPNLVDQLPFLTAGYWEKVHVVSLVPNEKRELTKNQMGMGGMGGYAMGGGYGPGGSGMAGGYGMMGPGGRMGSAMGGMAGEAGGTSGGYMGMGGYGGGGGGGDDMNFPQSQADKVMIRSLDFTVDPDTTYRFRLRVVVFNPNYSREDVNPGVDTKAVELHGPWSESTGEVTMPADITPTP
jgi:hypothetical protein